MADYYYGLALTSVMNTEKDYKRFTKAIQDISENYPYEEIQPINIKLLRPIVRKNIWETYYGEKQVLELKDSIGKISATSIIPYPPGIPLIVPGGEEITQELYDYIQFAMENGLEIVGLMGYNKDQIVVSK